VICEEDVGGGLDLELETNAYGKDLFWRKTPRSHCCDDMFL
jgi:hypothetical protein